MTRKIKLIILVSYLLILAIAILSHRINRQAKIRKLNADLSRIAVDQGKAGNIEAEAAELVRKIPTESHSTEFIEELYRYAKESGLDQHDVSTESQKSQTSARPGSASGKTSIEKHRIKISVLGTHRTVAEYIRRIQNIERFNRIVEFRLTPDGNRTKGTIVVELYSLSVKHVRQSFK